MFQQSKTERSVMKGYKNLSRRERQIMDIIYELGEASVAHVLERLPNPPSYSAVRALLRILEEKLVHHSQVVGIPHRDPRIDQSLDIAPSRLFGGIPRNE